MMHRLLLLSLLVFPHPVQAFSLHKPLHFAVAVDVTGSSKYITNYRKNALLVVKNTMRLAKENDTVTLYRVCSYVSTVATIRVKKAKSRLAKKQQAQERDRLAQALLKPCTGRGSAITKAAQMMKNKNVVLFFTDGGIKDDPQVKQFKAAVNVLEGKKAVWFAGLSDKKDSNTSIRDSLAAYLPQGSRTILSGQHDLSNGFGQFTRQIKQARR